MKYFDWDDARNARLEAGRGIGFEDIVFHIERGDDAVFLKAIVPEPQGDEALPRRGGRQV